MTMRASPQSLARRVAQLEASAKAAEPLLVLLRCFSGPCVRVQGPDGAEWLRGEDETPEAFEQRVKADARLAMHQAARPSPLWLLHERHTLTDRPFDKKECPA